MVPTFFFFSSSRPWECLPIFFLGKVMPNHAFGLRLPFLHFRSCTEFLQHSDSFIQGATANTPPSLLVALLFSSRIFMIVQMISASFHHSENSHLFIDRLYIGDRRHQVFKFSDQLRIRFGNVVQLLRISLADESGKEL